MAAAVDSSILQLFYKLAEDRPSIISATESLVNALDKSTDESRTYSWKRLVKGMSSNRKNARHGFSVALTELLISCQSISLKEVYDLNKEVNLPTGHVNQKEIRDLYAGYIFVISSLFRSNRLVEISVIKEILTDLYQILQKKKLTIKDVVFKVFLDILDSIDSEKLDEVTCFFKEDIINGWNNCTIERLAVVCYLEKRSSTSVGKLISKHWGYSTLCHPYNYDKIAGVMKTCICQDRIRPQLTAILDTCFNSPHFKIKKATKSFFVLDQTGENKNTVMFSMIHMLGSLSDDKVEGFVFKHMAPHLEKSFTSSGSSLQVMVTSLANKIVKISNKDSQLSIIKGILKMIPRRTSCLHKVIDLVATQGLKTISMEVVAIIQDLFIEPQKDLDHKIVTEFRVDCLNWILQIIKSAKMKEIFELTKFLFIYSYFTVEGTCAEYPSVKVPVPHLSTTTVESCKAKFSSCLKLLSSDATESRRGVAEDGRYWIYHLLSSSLLIVTNEKFPMIDDITSFDEWRNLWSAIDEIEAKGPEERSREDWAFELLFLHGGILYFDETEQGKVVLSDVYQCYENQKAGKTDNWRSILVDLLISILSYESWMLRNIASECFKMVCGDLDDASLELIFTPLETEEKEEEEEEDAESEEEADVESEEDEDDEEEEDEEEDDDDDEEDDEEDVEMSDNEEGVKEMDPEEEEEDVNLSDADEEELENENKSLGVAMRGLLDMKKEKKQAKKERALKKVKIVHFKVKILDFVEIMVKDNGLSLATLKVVPRLLKLVASPAVTSGPMYNKVSGVFKHILATKQDKFTVSIDETSEQIIPDIQDFICKTSNKEAHKLAFKTLFLLSKLLLNSQPPPKKKKRKSVSKPVLSTEERVSQMFSPILRDFLTNKNTKVDKAMLLQLIERFAQIRRYLVVDIMSLLSDSTTQFAKMQAVALIQRVLSFSDDSTVQIQGAILEEMGKLIREILGRDTPSPHHVREVLKLLIKLNTTLTKEQLTVTEMSTEVRSTVESISLSELSIQFPDLINLSKKLLSLYSK